MKFSIITATYNREKTIKRSIESTKSQDYKNVELVMIDGASSDKTVEAAKPYLTKNDILISEKDKGIYDALNKGIENSTGEIIGFLHSDDIFSTKSVLSMIASVFKENDVDLVYGDASFFKGKNINKSIRKYKSDKLSKKNLAWGKMPAHTAMFFKKEIYQRYGYFKTSYKICGDYEFLCRITSRTNIKSLYIPQVFVKMQTKGASTSGFSSTIQLNKEIYKACNENKIYTNYFMIMSKYPSKILQFLRTT
tara:strand:- start:201 stop:953 length:753 start_codon:yes stop_codon:yes gene_type:complete